MVALQTTETVVPGSIPASLTQQKALRTGRVTVYAVKSQGGEGNLPLRQKELLVRLPILYYNYTHFNPLRKASQLHDSLASCYTVAYRTVCHQSQTSTITTKKHPLFREIDLAHQSVT